MYVQIRRWRLRWAPGLIPHNNGNGNGKGERARIMSNAAQSKERAANDANEGNARNSSLLG